MWWPGIIVGMFMLGTGLIFVLRRKALADAYASRRKVLPLNHPQYRATPFFTPNLFALSGSVGIIGGVASILAGMF